jgi:ABC-type transporter Mla subunit MlaD
MANKMTIGAGIALDGEKEFKQAVSEINKSLSVLGSELNKVSAQYGSNSNSIQGLTAKQDVLERKLLTQKEKIEAIKKALQNAANEYGEASTKTQDWQIKLNNAEAELAKTEAQLRETTEQISKMGAEADEAGDETRKMGDNLGMASTKTTAFKDAQEKLEGALKKIAIAAAAAAAAIGVYINKALDNADAIQQMADKTGQSAEQIQEWQYVANNLGVSLDTITGSQARLTKAMSDARDGNKEVKEIFDKMAISVTDANGQLRNASDVMFDVIQRAWLLGNATEQDAAMMTLFGRSAQELNPLLRAGAKEMQRLAEEAHNTGAVMSNESVAALDALGDKFEALKMTLAARFGEALARLAPKITQLMDKLIEGINKVNFEPIINGLIKIAEHLPQIIALVGTLGAAFLAFQGVQIITSLASAFGLLGTAAAAAFSPIAAVAALVGGLAAALGIAAIADKWLGGSGGSSSKKYEYWSAGKTSAQYASAIGPVQQTTSTKAPAYTSASAPYKVVIEQPVNIDGRTVARQTYDYLLEQGQIRGVNLVR